MEAERDVALEQGHLLSQHRSSSGRHAPAIASTGSTSGRIRRAGARPRKPASNPRQILAGRNARSRIPLSVAGSTIAMAGLAAGLAVGWPSTAAAQPGQSYRPLAQAAAVTATAGSAVSAKTAAGPAAGLGLALIEGELLPAVKAAIASARQQELSRVARRAAAVRRAQRRAAVFAAAQQARAAQAAAAAASQPAASRAAAGQPAAATGSPQQAARAMLASYGWSADQFSCLDALWSRESGWSVTAANPNSGAYGIPQALPGSKMASAGPDWQTSAATQIRWGLGYIQGTYGSPCGAWGHEQADGWY